MSTEWLSRRLLENPYYLGLCLSEADYRASLKNLKVLPENQDGFGMAWSHAKVHHFIAPGNMLICIVTMDAEKAKLKTGCQIASLLCHEAVHVFQLICDYISEHAPSKEFEAYSIQVIAQELMQSYCRQTAPKTKSKKRKLR